MSAKSPRPAAFLDRDGTLIVEHGFLGDPDRVTPLPGAIEAVTQLNDWGYFVIGISNQSGVARGYYGEETVRAVNRRVIGTFADQGGRIDAIYYCPHYPVPDSAECGCRKPKRGLIEQAMREFAIDLSKSFVVGDRLCDVQLGHALDIPGILVLTGYGQEEHAAWSGSRRPDYVAESLLGVVTWWGRGSDLAPQ